METCLKPSLEKWGLPYDISYIEDQGDWSKNTNYKSTFILEMLNKHKCSVIFVDADAEILQYPKLFQEIPDEYDLGGHYLNWRKMWKNQEGNSRRDFLSGTLYIPYKEKTINLVQAFIKQIKKNPNLWEQKNMQKVIESHKDIKIYNLPYSYITFPLHNGQVPTHMVKEDDIVIWHTQASRKFKNRSNWRNNGKYS